MKTVRVEYTVILKGADGKTDSVNKERILYELESSDPEHIHQILEQELPAPEHPALGEPVVSSTLEVMNITELKPTGDDDQM